MALLGGKSVGCWSAPRGGPAAGRRVAVIMGALLSVAVLAGCEYADPELLPGSSSAVPQPFPSLTAISEDAAAQTELMAQVDAVMGEQAGIPSFGVAGGMRDGAGMSSFGSLTDAGTYPVRAA